MESRLMELRIEFTGNGKLSHDLPGSSWGIARQCSEGSSAVPKEAQGKSSFGNNNGKLK